jgi:aminoglycoside phosphotransferase (APT) family kinase protein
LPSKRPAPPAHVVDRALRLAGEGWSGEDIDRELGLHARIEGHELLEISDDAIREIVRQLLGSSARVESSTRLGPLATHGIQRRGGFTGNLVYEIVLERPRRKLILRFNRGLRDDVYDQELENYALVQSATGIRGPEILHIDRSRRVAPGEFMVMEHVEGELAGYLAHPDNPELSDEEKRRIRFAAGGFYAALHDRSRPAGDSMHEARRLLFGVYRLLDVAAPVSAGIDAAEIRACIQAFGSSSVLRSDAETLCFMDGELVFARQDGRWEPAYVCDLEWVGFRDRYADLVSQLCPAAPLWSLPSPGVSGAAVRAARSDSFFEAYRRSHDVDWRRLAALIPYYQLALWGHAVADQPDPAARDALLGLRGNLLTALMKHVLG